QARGSRARHRRPDSVAKTNLPNVRISARIAEKAPMATTFLSYAHDDEAHSTSVKALADRLRDDGIDAMIDAYEPHPANGWARWMERQFASSEYILIVASERYMRDYNQEVDNASGVTFEAAMLSGRLYRTGVDFSRIAIVYFNRWLHVQLPDLLHGCQRYSVD